MKFSTDIELGSSHVRISVSFSLCALCTCGDEDVGEDDEGRQEETGCLREPPPEVSERS